MSTPRALLLAVLATAPLAAQSATPPIRFGDSPEHRYDAPFFPGASYDAGITSPDAVLGQELGSRLSHHDEILACFLAWAGESPRLKLYPHGQTHEGRELVHAIVTSRRNHGRLEAIKRDLGRLYDPRGLDDATAESIVTGTPPVAWMAYSIHGDELSGSDAALAFTHHLIASTDEATAELLERIVIVVDPCMNPDGRERIVGMVEQTSGYTANLDYGSMHRGRWPYGRGNHYLFDLNRDWMMGTQPETRGRWHALRSFHPQLLVDAHEMGSLDTFLLYPQAEPLNPHFASHHSAWQRRYAEGIGAAFDRYGWGYYTREWADGWAPFYTDAWASLSGATGILYEQARTLGTSLRRESGQVLTYRESVHHQAVASLANVRVLAGAAEDALRAYLANARRNVAPAERMFVVRAGHHDERIDRLVASLLGQGVEALRTTADASVTNATGTLGETVTALELPLGSLVVPASQPAAQYVKAYLELDPRLDAQALADEREDLERDGETRIYDLTAWSLPHALDLDAWWCDASTLPTEPATLPHGSGGAVVYLQFDSGGPTAWAVDGHEDGSVVFAAHALEAGLAVHVADKEFRANGFDFARGSVIVRLHENPDVADEILVPIAKAATAADVTVIPLGTSLSPDEGPDLGGGHFHLLSRPRVAMLGNAPVSEDLYGHLWHHLDVELGIPFTLLDAQTFGGADLRRYDVLILPPTWSGLDGLLEASKDALEAWIQSGGTLIACGDSAAATTAGRVGLSAVKLRRDALDDLPRYREVAARQRAGRAVEIDEAAVWGDTEAPAVLAEDEEEAEVDAADDAWLRTFSPFGVTLRGEVDDRHWITVGCRDELPVLFTGAAVYLADAAVATPVRLAEKDRLRLGGLVWPEARERLGDSSWLTVERRGHGQVILFAALPGYRGYQSGTGRLFSNAVVYGPGLGTSRPVGW